MSVKYLLNAITHTVKQNLLKPGHLITHGRGVATEAISKPWQLVSAVCLERLPLICQTPTEFELKYSQLVETEEVEKSFLSDHELRYREDEKLLKKKADEMKNGDGRDDVGEETARKTTAELEDQWEIELNRFQFPSQLTAADKEGDTKSLLRRCDAKLVLLTKQKLGQKDFWVLPQGQAMAGESMRQAAERVLQELCGENIHGVFLGNTPCGFFKYKFPSDHPNIGAKVFFFKAHYKTGNVETNSTDLLDFCWLTKQEIAERTIPGYFTAIDRFILDL
ncbi:39S ribosomal protein L46, mitochondrial-like [Argonauta hians]